MMASNMMKNHNGKGTLLQAVTEPNEDQIPSSGAFDVDKATTNLVSGPPDYGIDAPDLVQKLSIMGGSTLAFGLVARRLFPEKLAWLGKLLSLLSLGAGVVTLFMPAWIVWTGKIGKFRIYQQMMDSIPWRGDEQVLDVGCGRGILLISAAKRLTSGHAIGVDIWRDEDQSGNHPDVTRRNAAAEGVAQRVEVRDADARDLPFGDASFDVVTSSLTLHNIDDPTERTQALQEMVRVLKPGGHLAIFDIRETDHYEQVLQGLNLAKVARYKPHSRTYLHLGSVEI